MVSRVLTWGFGIAAVGAFICAVCLYLWPPTEEPGITVDEPDRVYTDLVPGQVKEIEFLVHNRTGQAAGIIGPSGAAGGICLT